MATNVLRLGSYGTQSDSFSIFTEIPEYTMCHATFVAGKSGTMHVYTDSQYLSFRCYIRTGYGADVWSYTGPGGDYVLRDDVDDVTPHNIDETFIVTQGETYHVWLGLIYQYESSIGSSLYFEYARDYWEKTEEYIGSYLTDKAMVSGSTDRKLLTGFYFSTNESGNAKIYVSFGYGVGKMCCYITDTSNFEMDSIGQPPNSCVVDYFDHSENFTTEVYLQANTTYYVYIRGWSGEEDPKFFNLYIEPPGYVEPIPDPEWVVWPMEDNGVSTGERELPNISIYSYRLVRIPLKFGVTGTITINISGYERWCTAWLSTSKSVASDNSEPNYYYVVSSASGYDNFDLYADVVKSENVSSNIYYLYIRADDQDYTSDSGTITITTPIPWKVLSPNNFGTLTQNAYRDVTMSTDTVYRYSLSVTTKTNILVSSAGQSINGGYYDPVCYVSEDSYEFDELNGCPTYYICSGDDQLAGLNFETAFTAYPGRTYYVWVRCIDHGVTSKTRLWVKLGGTIVTSSGYMQLRSNSGYVRATPYIYTSSGWKVATPYIYDGINWVKGT